MSFGPLVSYVIPTYNGEEHIRACLDSVLSQSYENIEIIVVNDNSDDSTRQIIEDKYPEVKLINLPSNHGHAAAANIGFETARGSLLALLDDDVELEEGWTSSLVEEFERSDDSLALLHPRIQEPGNEYKTESGEITDFRGCGVMARKEALAECGYYDERYFVYSDDVELAANLLVHGYTMRSFPEVTTYHKTTWSSEATKSPFKTYYNNRNRLWFMWKYYDRKNAITHSLRFSFLAGKRAYRDGAFLAHLRALKDALKGYRYFIGEHTECAQLDYEDISITELAIRAGQLLRQSLYD